MSFTTRLAKLLFAGAASALLVACSSDNPHHLTSGTITGKGHEDAYTYVQEIQNCVDTGNAGSHICTNTPIFIHQDATWTITIKNCANDTPRQQNTDQCDKGKLYLTPEEWAGLKVGQWYDASGDTQIAPSASEVASS